MSDKERDELAELIANTECPNLVPPWPERLDRSPVKWSSRKTADALITAGYRKPRTITTTEERDNLPTGVVVRSSAGTIAARHGSGKGVLFGNSLPFPWANMALPFTVLYEPAQ